MCTPTRNVVYGFDCAGAQAPASPRTAPLAEALRDAAANGPTGVPTDADTEPSAGRDLLHEAVTGSQGDHCTARAVLELGATSMLCV